MQQGRRELREPLLILDAPRMDEMPKVGEVTVFQTHVANEVPRTDRELETGAATGRGIPVAGHIESMTNELPVYRQADQYRVQSAVLTRHDQPLESTPIIGVLPFEHRVSFRQPVAEEHPLLRPGSDARAGKPMLLVVEQDRGSDWRGVTARQPGQ